jgi:hypothetical protein
MGGSIKTPPKSSSLMENPISGDFLIEINCTQRGYFLGRLLTATKLAFRDGRFPPLIWELDIILALEGSLGKAPQIV